MKRHRKNRSAKVTPSIPAQYRQGDVYFTRIDSIPETAEPAKTDILVHGEATGHAHRLQGGEHLQTIDLSQITAQFVRVTSGFATVVHEEHDEIQLPAGNYRVERQREYTPEEIRNVCD